jgi:hypothetical protein
MMAAILAASLTACSVAPADGGPGHLPGRHPDPQGGCPLGRLLPAGEALAIDYVDFLRFGRTMYIASERPVHPVELGSVIARVRCSLVAEESQRRGEPPITNLTASFLKAGSLIYRMRGYPATCRLASFLNGRLYAYLAQTTVHGHTAPKPCAVGQTPGSATSDSR